MNANFFLSSIKVYLRLPNGERQTQSYQGREKEAENSQTSVKRARSMIHPQHKVSHYVTAWFGLLPMKKIGALATHSILS